MSIVQLQNSRFGLVWLSDASGWYGLLGLGEQPTNQGPVEIDFNGSDRKRYALLA
jgi:hypothetical protein